MIVGSSIKRVLRTVLPPVVLNYFTKGASRSIRLKKNVAVSLLIRCLNIVISFVLVPLTINYVNPTQYGIWITLSSIVAWFSFFDIGFGHGLRNKFAEAVALGKYKLARIYVSTTYAILTSVILVVLILFVVINPMLDWSRILNAPPSMKSELSTLALLVFVFFCLQFILQLVNVVLTANQEPAKAASFKFYSNLISLVVIFLLTKYTSGNLLYLATALGCAPVVILIMSSVIFYSKKYRRYAPSLRLVDLRFARNLMELGLKFFIIQICGIILYSTDNIIISQVFGPTEVTPYSLAFKYFSTVTVIFSIVMTPFWSAITEAYTKRDFSWIQRSIRSMVRLATVLILLVVLMLVFAQPIYRIWIGEQVQIPFLLNLCMAVYFVMGLLLQPFTYFINGTGRITLQLTLNVAMALVNIPLALFLARIPALGVSGVMLSTIICFLPGLILTPLQYKKIVSDRASGLWAK